MCSCTYTINVPYVYQPNQWGTTVTITSTPELIKDFDIIDTENKIPFATKNQELTVLHRDEKEGLYAKLSDLQLPLSFKDCFHQLKSTGGYNLWQIRSPLTFRFNLPNPTTQVKEPHFFTLQSVTDVMIAKSVSLAYPIFQEVTDQLELIRLVEIQRVFVKLLGRL